MPWAAGRSEQELGNYKYVLSKNLKVAQTPLLLPAMGLTVFIYYSVWNPFP